MLPDDAAVALLLALAADVARRAGMDFRLRGRSGLALLTTTGPSTSAAQTTRKKEYW
jgi:hypothetical protein